MWNQDPFQPKDPVVGSIGQVISANGKHNPLYQMQMPHEAQLVCMVAEDAQVLGYEVCLAKEQ